MAFSKYLIELFNFIKPKSISVDEVFDVIYNKLYLLTRRGNLERELVKNLKLDKVDASIIDELFYKELDKYVEPGWIYKKDKILKSIRDSIYTKVEEILGDR